MIKINFGVKMSKNIYKVLLIAVLALGLFNGANAFGLASLPDISFAEEGSDNTLDLDVAAYFDSTGGAAPYIFDRSGNTRVSVAINPLNNVVTFTAAANWNGYEDITFTVRDSSGPPPQIASDTLRITVTPVNDAPVATNDAYTIAEDVVLTVPVATGVLANDVDVDGTVPIAVKVVNANPLHGTLAFNADGSFTYTPTANYNGPDSFTYKANDGVVDSNVATVSLTITAANDAPTIISQTETLYPVEGAAFSHQVNFSDIDANPGLVFTATPTVAWAGFAINAQTGLISFTPTAADVGSHLVDIKVKDSANAEETKTFRFFVREACYTPSITFQDISIEDITGDDDQLLPGDYLEAVFDVKNGLGVDLTGLKVKADIKSISTGERFSAKIESAKYSIDSGESKEAKLRIRVDPDAEQTEGLKSTYALYLRAEGNDENDNSACGYYSKDVKVDREDTDVLIEASVFSADEVSCGDAVTASATIWNIGDGSEDSVKFRIKNSLLKVDTATPVFDLDRTGSDQKAAKELSFTVPADAKAGDYPVEFIAGYGDNSEAITKNIKVACTATTTATEIAASGTATIAVVQDTINADREQTVKYTVTLTNTNTQATNYKVSLAGMADWATGLIEPEDITLAPGASMPIYAYLTPKFDATGGDHTSTLTIKSGATVLDSKTLTTNVNTHATTITERGNMLSGSATALSLGANRDSILFVVIVLIVIIGAAVMLARRDSGGDKKTKVLSNF
ncbi:MAG TPA: putative S-layer protein [Nanoarchaeota archaeon]|nr:putative S-layer protein [Nanoarchaeota archaeon]